jgi:small-conductance mechanosensitive channel
MGVATVLAGGNASVVDEARQFLEQLTTWEGRVAATVVLLVLTLVLAMVIVPVILRFLWHSVLGELISDRVTQGFVIVGEYVPTTLGGIVIRSVQFVLLLFAVIALLVLWGLADVAADALVFIGLSIPFLVQIVLTLVLLLLAFVGSDVLEESISRFSQGADRVTEHQEEILLRVGQIGLLLFALMAALTVWQVDLSGLLVGAGFLGIVVGLAARQTLGSLIAGFVLMFSRPFTIGDWVEIGTQQGIVTEITIFNTRLENFDGEFVVLPNDKVSNEAITNRSKKGHLRIKIDVGIDYDSDPEHAKAVAIDAIEDVKLVDPAPPPQVIPKAFGDSAVVLEMRFWIDRPTPPRKWQATAAVVSAVKARFEAEGIKIPFPQRELMGRAETGGFHVHDPSLDTAQGEEDRSTRDEDSERSE